MGAAEGPSHGLEGEQLEDSLQADSSAVRSSAGSDGFPEVLSAADWSLAGCSADSPRDEGSEVSQAVDHCAPVEQLGDPFPVDCSTVPASAD